MNLSEYTRMEKFEKTFWWHKGRFYLLSLILNKHLPKKEHKQIFEIGCGTGETITFLSTYGEVTGIDISPEAVEFFVKKGKKNVILGDINDLDMKIHKGKYDAVLALDVFEHVREDQKTMKRASEMLSDDGILLITVPAHKFLWSDHDEALQHVRRYHPRELRHKLTEANLEIMKFSYFVTTAFFPIFLIRMWRNIYWKASYHEASYVPLPKKLNKFAINILKVEARLFQMIGLPVGTTLVAVAKKSDVK